MKTSNPLQVAVYHQQVLTQCCCLVRENVCIDQCCIVCEMFIAVFSKLLLKYFFFNFLILIHVSQLLCSDTCFGRGKLNKRAQMLFLNMVC